MTTVAARRPPRGAGELLPKGDPTPPCSPLPTLIATIDTIDSKLLDVAGCWCSPCILATLEPWVHGKGSPALRLTSSQDHPDESIPDAVVYRCVL